VITQLSPAPNIVPQVLVCENLKGKPGVIRISAISNVLAPLLVSVTTFGGVQVHINPLPLQEKPKLVGNRVTFDPGLSPVPFSEPSTVTADSALTAASGSRGSSIRETGFCVLADPLSCAVSPPGIISAASKTSA
jgi:hypothetical protein